MKILYQDDILIIAEKEPGMLSESGNDRDNSLPRTVADNLNIELPHPVHRLDKEVGGALLLAKTAKSMAMLTKLAANNQIFKTYTAVTVGVPKDETATLNDLLYHDKGKNKTFTVTKERKGVKAAALTYKVRQIHNSPYGMLSLIDVTPHTGRTHQIRVQFASRKYPLFDDRKYGGKINFTENTGHMLGLWCSNLKFTHPITGEPIDVTSSPPQIPPFCYFTDV